MKHKNLKNLPLKGIKVLDAASYIAAPLVSALMTDYGAEVIKIESHTGDTYRDAVKGGHVWPESEMDWAFILENRNKRSLSIDLKTEEGQIILKKLVKESDVLITNMPGEPRKKLGLDESKIRKMNKKIIYASLTAYGEKGPDSKRTAFDATAYYARSGLMEWSKTNNADDHPPFPIPGGGDHPTGLSLFTSILLALINREKTGKGMFIDVSMLDCQIAILENAIARYLSKNEIPQPMGSRHPSIAPFEAFKTKDSYIIIAAGNDKLFEKLCNALDMKAEFNNEKFKTNALRCKNMDELKLIMEKKLKVLNTKEWTQKLEKDKIPCGPIFNIKDAVENPQIKARNMIINTFHKVAGDFKAAGNPIKMSSYADSLKRGDVPDLDENREKIIKEFCN